MKTRQKAAAAVSPAPSKQPVLVAVHKPTEGFEELNKKKKAVQEPAEGAEVEKKQMGGFRPGAGRPAYLKPEQRKKVAAYMSMTEAEKAILERKAEKAGLTLSYYMRKCCGLSIRG